MRDISSRTLGILDLALHTISGLCYGIQAFSFAQQGNAQRAGARGLLAGLASLNVGLIDANILLDMHNEAEYEIEDDDEEHASQLEAN